MISTRSNRTNYTIQLADNPRPVRSNGTPISRYFAQLHGLEKSEQIRFRRCPFDRAALNFNWFLRYIVPLKKADVEESFEDIFSQISSMFYPNNVRAKFSKARQRKSEAVLAIKRPLKAFYDPIYGPERLFDIKKSVS